MSEYTPESVRVSLFSAWEKPSHFFVHEGEELEMALFNARQEQKGIVLTYPDQPEPTEWNGGLDDRR